MIELQLIGNLGKDAIKNEVNGKAVLNFSVAHTEKFRSGDEQKEKTIWVDCAYWTDKTGILPYMVKGQQVYVKGSPEVRTWDKDGKHGATLTLRVSAIQLIGRNQEVEKKPAISDAIVTDDNLPF